MALRNKIIATALLGAALTVVGCGSAGSNDQGVSFTLLGFAPLSSSSDSSTSTCDFTANDNVITIPIGETEESNSVGIQTIRCFLVQNNLTVTGIRTERVNLEFYVPGADRQPPTTSVPATVFLGAATGTDAPSQGSTDDSAAGDTKTGANIVGNRGGTRFDMIPPEIRSWLSLNRESLPEAPFSLEIVASVVAVTTAGDQMESNKAYYQAQVVNDLIINPDSGTTDEGATDEALTSDAALENVIE